MMRIGIEINGVLRDTIEKFKQVYQKNLIEVDQNEIVSPTFQIDLSGNTEEIKTLNTFNYEILSDVTSLDLMNHFSFRNKEELYSFMYEEYTMELFGHAPSTEMNTFNTLNEIYYNLRDKYELIIVSDEIGKSKPASLFFLSKFGCLLEKIIFYCNSTKNQMWNEVDILLTADPALLLEKPNGKMVIKYNTSYNKQIKSDFDISSISEFEEILESIIENV